jgi:hypothetical protein
MFPEMRQKWQEILVRMQKHAWQWQHILVEMHASKWEQILCFD